ncbi:MAG: glycosyltransferase [Patescibacteria group bacterium]
MNNKERNVKICQVVSSDFTLRFMLFDQLKFLRSQDYDVHAVCSPGKWIQSLENEGIKVKTIKLSRRMISPFSDLLAFIRLFFYFKKEKFDIVHVHTPKAEIYGQLSAYLAGVPIILNTLHGFGSDLPRSLPYWQKKLYLLLQKITGKYSSVVFSISDDIINKAKEHKIFSADVLLYLGRDIDTDRFNPQNFNDEFKKRKKKELSIPDDKRIVGIVARLVVEKGYLELFEAFQEILKKYDNVVLLVVGPLEPEKKDPINLETIKSYGFGSNVIFLGDRTDVQELYSVMDIFVLPSRREGLGAVILEASSMERPVIATNTGGILEAVDDGKTGILIPVNNPNKIVSAIGYLLDNPEIAREMGIMGRKKVIQKFSKKIVLERLGSAYEELIKKKLNTRLEDEWFSKYSRAARDGKKEHEIMFHSKTGFRNDNVYFFDYFKKHIGSRDYNLKNKILDVGCGFGDTLMPLLELGFQCYGVDYIPEIIEAAKNKDKSINFQVADAYNLPFEDGFFDIVICKGVLQVLSDSERAIGELKRVLKKDGLLIIVTLNVFALDILLQKEKLIRYNPYRFKGLMRQNGFDRFNLKGVYVMPSFLDFMADVIIKLRIHRFFNLFLPLFIIFSHNFYLEARKVR